MTHGSLFSGIGGFDLAAEWMGWENVFHCEWEDFPRKVLKHYWSDAISYGDITKTDFTIHRGEIDILTGGFPCQPYSSAGKRLGKEDDRHLWPSMCRAIREIQPRWVVGENVRGLTNWNGGMVFDEVQADLEAEGYEVLPFLLPACGVNAPHRRDRIWFVAKNAKRNGFLFGESNKKGTENGKQRNARAGNSDRVCQSEVAEPTPNPRYAESQGSKQHQRDNKGSSKKGIQKRNQPTPRIGNGDVANSYGIERSERGMHKAEPEKAKRHSGTFNSRDGRGAWENFPTQSPVCDGNDGLSSRLDGITFPKWRRESIKAGGNAIVPRWHYKFLRR